MTDTESPEGYQVGGSLNDNHPTYIKRMADDELLRQLKAGELCFVINARQMGKSSLLNRTRKTLQQEGYDCAVLDLLGIGVSISQENWYKAIVEDLAKNCNNTEIDKYWQKLEKNQPSIVQRFMDLARFLFKKIKLKKNKFFIFIDEIDTIKNFNFDYYDFFAFIQTYYNNKIKVSPDQTLVFSLFGNAHPTDLFPSKDYKFNIGKSIYLEGFKQTDELEPLAQGLLQKFRDPSYTAQQAIKEVLTWTNGQPFLTQKICQLIQQSTDEIPLGKEGEWIGELIQEEIIDHWRTSDSPEHFRTIRNRIVNEDQYFIKRLEICKKVLQKESVPYNDLDPVHQQLTVSGLAINQQGYLRVFNRIYEHIYKLDWIEEEINNYFPYSVQFNKWIKSKKKDQSQLLIGQVLKKAEQWKEGKELDQEKNNFYHESLKFDGSLKECINYLKKDKLDYEQVMRAIWQWTKGDNNLDEKVIGFLDDHRNPIPINKEDKERDLVDKIITECIDLDVNNYRLLMKNKLSSILEASMFSQENHQTIIDSFDKFIESKLFVKHPLLIFSAIMELTNNHPVLIELIIQVLLEQKKVIATSELNKIIDDNLIHDWQTHIGAEHFQNIRQAIINNQATQPYRLIKQYEKILLNPQQSQTKGLNELELNELEKIGLVYKDKDSEGKFKVHNDIYKKVFNQEWVKRELNALKPYAEKLAAWSKSDEKLKDMNPSLLLAGDELEEAQKWIDKVDDVDKKDYKYIMRCMVYQKIMNSGES